MRRGELRLLVVAGKKKILVRVSLLNYFYYTITTGNFFPHKLAPGLIIEEEAYPVIGILFKCVSNVDHRPHGGPAGRGWWLLCRGGGTPVPYPALVVLRARMK